MSLLLFGLAVLHTVLYLSAASMLLMLGAAITCLTLLSSGIPFSVAVAWMGYALFAEKDVPPDSPNMHRGA